MTNLIYFRSPFSSPEDENSFGLPEAFRTCYTANGLKLVGHNHSVILFVHLLGN